MKQSLSALLSIAVAVTSACQSGPTEGATQADVSVPSPTHASATMPVASNCRTNEQVLFSCTIEEGIVSLCATSASGSDVLAVRLLLGQSARPEVVYDSANAGADNPIRRSHLAFAGSTGGYGYSVKNGKYKYTLYSFSGADGLGKSGLLSDPLDQARKGTAQNCRKGSLVETDDIKLIKTTSTFPEDPDIQRAVLSQDTD